MKKGNFDLEDFLSQLNQIKKLGPLENLIKLIPGAKKMGLNNVNIDPKQMKHIEAIILSMTKEERQAMFGREITDKQKEILSNAHKKENLSKETIEAMSIANILNREFAYSKNSLNFKTQNDTNGTLYEEGFMKINDSDFIVLN